MTMNVTWFKDKVAEADVARDMFDFHNAISIASEAKSDPTPDTATYIKIVCTEAAYVAYGNEVGKAPTASSTNGDYVPAGVPLWLKAAAGHQVSGIAV